MSVKRYDVGMTEETNSRTGFYASYPRVYEAEQGRYVEYEDYAKLKAEVARLLASSFVTAVPCEHYERVVKAGDAMEKWIRLTSEQTITGHLPKSIKRWTAAKKGKPSV